MDEHIRNIPSIMLKGFEKSLVKTIPAARPNLKQSSIQTSEPKHPLLF